MIINRLIHSKVRLYRKISRKYSNFFDILFFISFLIPCFLTERRDWEHFL